jgi:hypothetical protein
MWAIGCVRPAGHKFEECSLYGLQQSVDWRQTNITEQQIVSFWVAVAQSV